MKAKALLVFGSITLTLLIAEGVARCFHSVELPQRRICVYNGVETEWASEGLYYMWPDERISGTPNATFTHRYDGPGAGHFEDGNCITYRFNSWGYREVEFKPEKAPDVYRIAVFGDSFTVGEGTQFEEIYTRRLASALKTKTVYGKQFEVLSLALAGVGTLEELFMYELTADTLKPDLVVLQWTTNDFPAQDVLNDHQNLVGVRYQQMFKDSERYAWSALVHYFWYSFKQKQIAQDTVRITTAELEKGRANFQQIRLFRNEAAKHGAQFVLLIFPEIIAYGNYPYHNILDALNKFCAQEHIDVIDLYPALSKHRARDLWAHETDHHPNHLAHEIACQEILKYLKLN